MSVPNTQVFDVFTPAQRLVGQPVRPSLRLDTPRTVSDMQVRIVPSEIAPAAKKPAYDHLRPRYVVQRAPSSSVVEQTPHSVPKPRPQPEIQPRARPTTLVDPVVARPVSKLKPGVNSESALLPPSQLVIGQRKDVLVPVEPVKSARKRLWRKLLLPALVAPCVLGAGLMLQSAAVGEVFIGVYAVIALVRRVASRTTFALALVSFVCIVALLLVRPDPVLMKNFAIYSFLFIFVGTLSLTMETRY